jgi:hypothetical protein
MASTQPCRPYIETILDMEGRYAYLTDIPKPTGMARSSRFHRSTSTATHRQLAHQSFQHRSQLTEPRPTRQRTRRGLSQTIGHLRRRSVDDRPQSPSMQTPVLHRDWDGH